MEEQGFLVLDGGLATELEARGHDLDHPLWSAKLLWQHPEAIAGIHRRYLEAGADCITAAGYQATLQGLAREGFSPQQSRDVLTRSVGLARDCRDAWVRRSKSERWFPLVAAGLGPYGAYLADGSEYKGQYGLSQARLEDFHAERMEVLWQAGPDLLALETVPDLVETRALMAVLRSLPEAVAWISFSCADDRRLWDGTPIETAAAVCADLEQVVAVGINCTAPRHLPSLIRRLSRTLDGPHIVVYPNSGEEIDPRTGSWVGRSDAGDYGSWAKEWLDLGARWIGGCCRTGPEHIRHVRRALDASRA